MPRSAAVAELKANLSRFLRHVKAGEEVLVTERGVAVARIVPVVKGDEVGDELRDLERQGLAKVGTSVLPADFWALPRPRDPKCTVRHGLAKEREEGW
jgi:prevent-host-death family protein